MKNSPQRLEPLCRCNNCGNVFIDLNPQNNQPKFDAKDYKTLERLFVDISKPELDYWGCPVCMTDGFLMDIETNPTESITDIAAGIACDLRPAGKRNYQEWEEYAISVALAVVEKIKTPNAELTEASTLALITLKSMTAQYGMNKAAQVAISHLEAIIKP